MCEYSLSSEKGDGLQSYNPDHGRFDHPSLPEGPAQSTNPRGATNLSSPQARDVGGDGAARMSNHLFIPQYEGHQGVEERYSVEVQDSPQNSSLTVSKDEPHRTILEIHQNQVPDQDQLPTPNATPTWPQDIWLHNESCRVLYQPVLVFPHSQPGYPPPRPINPEQPPTPQPESEIEAPAQPSHHPGPDSLVSDAPQSRDEPEVSSLDHINKKRRKTDDE